MRPQLKIEFEQEPSECNYVETPICKKLMSFLDKWNKEIEEQNKEMQAMLNELQEGWSDEEKLQINDPKEYQRQQKLKQEQKQKQEKEMPELTEEAIECLKNSTVDGMVVKLPEKQLERKVYLEVKGRLELIGGKWKGGKIGGFVFQECPKDLLNEISNGGKRNIKKEFQFFATPDELADQLAELAEIDVRGDMEVLEPSAGQGAIIKAINRAADIDWIDCYELMPLNQSILKKNFNTVRLLGSDFLKEAGEKLYDRIVANPPFSKNQDIDHIKKMYDCLKPGGRIVTVASNHWKMSGNKKEIDFKKWLDQLGATHTEIPAGTFKESGTTVSACIVIINKHL